MDTVRKLGSFATFRAKKFPQNTFFPEMKLFVTLSMVIAQIIENGIIYVDGQPNGSLNDLNNEFQ